MTRFQAENQRRHCGRFMSWTVVDVPAPEYYARKYTCSKCGKKEMVKTA